MEQSRADFNGRQFIYLVIYVFSPEEAISRTVFSYEKQQQYSKLSPGAGRLDKR